MLAATPVPDSGTGELATVTAGAGVALFTVTDPVALPDTVGVNTTLMVHDAPFAKVVPQFPPAAPAGREKPVPVTDIANARVAPVEFLTVSVCAALAVAGVVTPTLPKLNDAGVTDIVTPVPVRVTGDPVTVVPAVV